MMEKRMIYLDNSATTPLSEVARRAIERGMDIYGNPSSLHSMGLESRKLIDEARRQVLSGLGVRRRKDGGALVFTSSGTEATSLALLGTAHAKERRDATRILTTNSEHPSVARVMDKLSSEGFEIVRISTRDGVLDMDELRAALEKKIFLASFMLVNNETGAIYKVAEAFKAIKQKYPDAVTHCDAVQGFMKVAFTPSSISADLVTVSAHKLHAPKGVGALYISSNMLKARRIVPFILGGGQEDGMRSGTENILGITAFGASVEDIEHRRGEIATRMEELRAYADQRLSCLDIRINRPVGERLANIINITLPKIKSETMLHALSADGIFVSSGSACSSHSKHPSDSLVAFGLSSAEADMSLRISMSEYNTKEDIDALCESLEKNISRLVKIK